MMNRTEYPQSLPAAVPDGRVLVHNGVCPSRRQGQRGSRYWLQPPADTLEVCDCGWAPELGDHYRVNRLPTRPSGTWPNRAGRRQGFQDLRRLPLVGPPTGGPGLTRL